MRGVAAGAPRGIVSIVIFGQASAFSSASSSAAVRGRIHERGELNCCGRYLVGSKRKIGVPAVVYDRNG
jgi:hypothetical protein